VNGVVIVTVSGGQQGTDSPGDHQDISNPMIK